MSTPDPKMTLNTDTAPTSEGRNSSGRALIGFAVLASLLILGLIVSVAILVRGSDDPLVPANEHTPGAVQNSTSEQPQAQFEPDPFLDKLGRPVYIALDERGAILEQRTPPSGRPATEAPGGVILQQVHGNMMLPFSATDGPTGFTGNGVATGFSRTPQGAALSAVHYTGYLSSGNSRIDMLADAGLVDDGWGWIESTKRSNTAGGPGAMRDKSTAIAFALVRVDYHEDIARVHFGMNVTFKDTGAQNVRVWIDVVWRERLGWIVKLRNTDSFSADTVAVFANDWSTWW